MLRIKTTDGGSVGLSTLKDGSVILIPVPDKGYAYDWKTANGDEIDIARSFAENVTLIACFATS